MTAADDALAELDQGTPNGRLIATLAAEQAATLPSLYHPLPTLTVQTIPTREDH